MEQHIRIIFNQLLKCCLFLGFRSVAFVNNHRHFNRIECMTDTLTMIGNVSSYQKVIDVHEGAPFYFPLRSFATLSQASFSHSSVHLPSNFIDSRNSSYCTLFHLLQGSTFSDAYLYPSRFLSLGLSGSTAGLSHTASIM